MTRKKLLLAMTIVILGVIGSGLYAIWRHQAGPAPSKPRELVVLTPNSQNILTGTIPAFEEKYGIKIRLIQGSTGQLIDRLQKDKDQLHADIFLGELHTI